MKKYLLPETGNFYKANLHVHTNISDGRMTPERVKEIYKSKGYSIIAITDHQILLPHPELDDEDFLTITAAEIAKNKGDYMVEPSTHFNIYAKNPKATTFPYFDPSAFWGAIIHAKEYLGEEAKNYERVPYGYPPEDLNRVIAACNEAGYLICLNHPKNSFQNYAFYGSLRGLWGVECFNSGCYLAGYYEDMTASDDLWREGERRVYPIAADDAHSEHECGLGYVMVKSDALEYSSVMNALERGDFYASTGIEIKELYIEDEVLHVEVDGADEIVLSTPIRFRRIVKSGDEPITSWSCELNYLLELCEKNRENGKTKDVYFRLDFKRADGKEAHTKAYFVDELFS